MNGNENHRELKSYEELNSYLMKDAIVTLHVGDTILNIKRIRKGVRYFLALDNYGTYPYDTLLGCLLNRHNLRVFVYEQPPRQEKCPIIETLLKYWIGGSQ